MAPWKKVAWSAPALVLLVVGAGVQAVVGWRAVLFGPRARALTARTFEATPERLERGRYLAEARHGCVFCHSERDWSAPGAPPRAERLAAGVVWAAEGMPWLTAPATWYLLKTDGVIRPFIFQDRENAEFTALTEESDEGFRREKFLYGVRARYRLAYGYLQFAVRMDFVPRDAARAQRA